MNEDIMAGLKIAMERGESIGDAMQSFKNAGYTASEIEEAASIISKGFSQLPTVAEASKSAEAIPPKPKEISPRAKQIIIILIILVLVGIALSFIFLRNQFMSFFLSIIDAVFP